MNRESAYALSFLILLLSSLFYFNLVTFDQQTLSRFDFLYNNSQKSIPIEACDYSKGQWVWDENYYSHQLYDENCPFLDPGFRCRQNGRNNEGFRKWRWQPDGCDLPRYVTCMFILILYIDIISSDDAPFYFVACMHACMTRIIHVYVFFICYDIVFFILRYV